MSGSALSPWASVQEPVYYAVQAARQLGCSVPDDLYRHYEALLHCLRDKPFEQILQVRGSSMTHTLTHIAIIMGANESGTFSKAPIGNVFTYLSFFLVKGSHV
uniref:Carboxylesterase type B domain-containing protein n=1 Tax=Scylla olivacea TaxID=85551 RepID=A0A0N7Z9P8_SCYOL